MVAALICHQLVRKYSYWIINDISKYALGTLNSFQLKIEKSSEYFVQSKRNLEQGNIMMLMFIYRETRIKKQDIKVTITFINHR